MKFSDLKFYAINFAVVTSSMLISAEVRASSVKEEKLERSGSELILTNASHPSIGLIFDGGDNPYRALVYTDNVSGEPAILSLDGGGVTATPLKDPAASVGIKLDYCLWGDLLFCQGTETIVLPRTVLVFDIIYARDFLQDKEYFAYLPTGFASSGESVLRDAYGEFLVVESDSHIVAALAPSTSSPDTLDFHLIAIGAVEPRSPVIGPGGGYSSKDDIHVVYQNKNPTGWTMHAWSLGSKTVVTSIDAGSTPPNPSDMLRFAYLEGGSPTTVMMWDSTPPYSVPGEDPPPPVYPVSETILTPEMHGCSSLHNVKIGSFFAAVRGDECGTTKDETKLFVVTMNNGAFVGRNSPRLYQPFEVVLLGEELGRYTAYEDYLAFEEDNDLVVMGVSRYLLQNLEPYGRSLSPWNLTARVGREIDYAGGEQYHDWSLYLSDRHEYRISVVSGWECLNWYDDVHFYVNGMGVADLAIDNETPDTGIPATCPAVDVTPDETGWYNIRIYRLDAGVPGISPPLSYQLEVKAL